MNTRYCWRLTDNKHWDSPGRMADGRIFTDWRSSSVINKQLAQKAGIPYKSEQFNMMLQKSDSSTLFNPDNKQTGDTWGSNYSPPPAKDIIVPTKLSGLQILKQDIPSAIGVEIGKLNMGSHKLRTPNVPISNCTGHPMSISDPKWGLTRDTLIFNMRDAVCGGGNTTGWLNGTVEKRDDRV